MSNMAENLPPISFDIALGDSLRANSLEIDVDLDNVSSRLEEIGALGSPSCLSSIIVKQSGSFDGAYYPKTGEMVISIGDTSGNLDDEQDIARVWYHETDHVEVFQAALEVNGRAGVEALLRSQNRQKILFLTLGGIVIPYAGAAIVDVVGGQVLPEHPNVTSALTIISLVTLMYYGFRTAYHKTLTSTSFERRAYSAEAEFAERYTDNDAVIRFHPHLYQN